MDDLLDEIEEESIGNTTSIDTSKENEELELEEELNDNIEEEVIVKERPLDEIDFSKVKKLIPQVYIVLKEGEKFSGLEFKYITSLVKSSKVSDALRDTSEENLAHIKELREQSIELFVRSKGVDYPQGSFLPTQVLTFMDRFVRRDMELYINGEKKDIKLIYSLSRQ